MNSILSPNFTLLLFLFIYGFFGTPDKVTHIVLKRTIMELVFNTEPTIMIHSFKYFKNDLNLIGDTSDLELEKLIDPNSIDAFEERFDKFKYITFDDGLYQQIGLIKLFKRLKSKVIFFPSFGLLRPEELPPNPIDNSIAHSNKTSSLSTFMTSTEAWDLMQSGYKLGMHGWYHLNLNLNHPDMQGNYLRTIKNDAKLCAKKYSELIANTYNTDAVKDANVFTHYFCTPYNIMNKYQKLYIQFLVHYLKVFNITIPTSVPQRLIIFSYERISIENFIKETTCHYVKD